MPKKYYIDKNYVLGTIAAQQKTVSEFCKELGCSRVNFYVALNRGYKAPRSVFISSVINKLNLVESLVWTNE